MPFRDRTEAGQYLAPKLAHYRHQPDVLVLALPRGGVPVGYAVAKYLGAPLDVFLVRKLGLPGHEELAMGAIASGGVRVLNEEVVNHLQVPEKTIEAVTQVEMEELRRREQQYRGRRSPLPIFGKTVILIDDGLATGSTMRAAATSLRSLNPKRLVVAVPVGAASTCEEFQHEVDEIVCALSPAAFMAVGQWYEDFSQTSDDEVKQLLEKATAESQQVMHFS